MYKISTRGIFKVVRIFLKYIHHSHKEVYCECSKWHSTTNSIACCGAMLCSARFIVPPIAGVTVQFAEQPTNGVTYFKAVSSITSIPQDIIAYVPLFCSLITKWVMLWTVIRQHTTYCTVKSVWWCYVLSYFHHISLGAGDMNHRDFSQECDLHTGGLSVSPHLCQHHTVLSSYEQVK